MSKKTAASLLLVLIFVTSDSVEGQHGGGGGPTSVPVEDTPNPTPVDGELWVQPSDLQMFIYSDSLGVFLGSEVWVNFDRAAAGASGFLRHGAQGIATDTTVTGDKVRGFTCVNEMRLMTAYSGATTGTAPDCTTRVWYANAASATDLVWAGNTNTWTPTDVTVPAGGVIAPELITNATDPDNPNIWMLWRAQVDPTP